MSRRAVIYTRISRADRDKVTGEILRNGVENQLTILQEKASRDGLDVVRVISDNDKSATRGKRERFLDLVGMISSRQVDVVLAFSLDRLARTRGDLADLLNAASTAGVDFALFNGSDIATSTPAGRLAASMLGAVATAEAENMSLRLQTGYQGRVRRGMHVPRQRCFGYEHGNMTAHPEEAAIVRELYQRVANGESIAGLARELRERGVVSTKGKPLSRSSISVILKNPRYAGRQEYRIVERDSNGKETGRRQVRFIEELSGGSIRGRDKSTLTPIPPDGEWESLVSTELWERVQLLRAAPQLRPPGASTQKWLLAGVATCGECGSKLGSSGSSKHGSLYICRAAAQEGKSHLGRTAGILDDAVSEVVVHVLSTMDTGLLERTGGRTANLTHERETLVESRLQLADQVAMRAMTVETFSITAARIDARLAEVNAELVAEHDSDELSALPLGEGSETVRAAWNELDIPAKKRIVRRLFRISIGRVGRGRPKHPLEGVTMEPIYASGV